MILNSKKLSFYILTLLLILYITLFLFTEIIYDYSLLSSSYIIPSVMVIMIIMAFIYTKFNSTKLPALVSILVFLICVLLGVILYISRHKVRYEIIDQSKATDLLFASIEDDVDMIKFKTHLWTSKYPITVLFYKEANKKYSNEVVFDGNIEKLKEEYIQQILKSCKKRQFESDTIIESLNSNYVNEENYLYYIKVLNSIHFSKFPKNLVILIEIFDTKNLVADGFQRTVVE